MKTLQVLIVRNKIENNTARLNALEQEQGWNIQVANSDEAAIELSCSRTFDVVVMDENLGEEILKKLKAVFRTHASDTIIITQNGNDHEALKAEIKKLSDTRKLERLQRIRVNDTLDVSNLEDDIRVA